MKVMNMSQKKKSQRLKVRGHDDNCGRKKNECHGSPYQEQTDNFKNVIFMRHGRIDFSYRTMRIYYVVHVLLNAVRKFVNKHSLDKENKFHRVFSKLIKKIKKVLSRFADPDIDYGNLNYKQFMRFLLHDIDPPLADKKGINIQKIPKEIDVIYHSSAKRSIESAKYIQRQFRNRDKQPRIESCLARELDDVRFSKNILSKNDFNEHGGLKGSRAIILKKWYDGSNEEESFQDSISRIEKLYNFIKNSPDKNILLITHGWYLRLLYMYFKNQEKSLKNLKSDECVFKYGESFQVRLRQNFSPHISFLVRKV